MWPWEHLAVGYLCYSLWTHWRRGEPPVGLAVVAVVVATQLPDLIDKPLAWWLGVLPSGRSLGHSLLLAVPLILGVRAIRGKRIGGGFAVGYLSHLVADVITPALLGRSLDYTFLIWPLVERPAVDTPGAWFRTARFFREFLAFLTSSQGLVYLGFEVALLGAAVALWLYDGRPGLARASFRRDEAGGGGEPAAESR